MDAEQLCRKPNYDTPCQSVYLDGLKRFRSPGGPEAQPVLSFHGQQVTGTPLGHVIKNSLYYFGPFPFSGCWAVAPATVSGRPPGLSALLAPTVPLASGPPPEARAHGRLIRKPKAMKFRMIICECGDRMKAKGPI